MTHPDTLTIPRAVVEPAYLMSPDGQCYAPSKPPLSAGNAKGTLLTLYTATAIAAARVQAINECEAAIKSSTKGWGNSAHEVGLFAALDAIRALIGKEST